MKSIEEIKAKLQKLFAMMEDGSGASEQEVQTAMVKARKLMAEYKLTEADISDKKAEKVIQEQVHDIVFSTQKNPWISNLASVIGNNYCCHAVMYHTYGAKTRNPGFIGFKNDVDMAVKVLKYAVDCALAEGSRIRRSAIKNGYTNADATAMCNAWGAGYVRGIQTAFERQNQEEKEKAESFALIMVEPEEVKEYVENKCQRKTFNTSNATSKARNYDRLAVAGYKVGCEFNMKSKLTA